MLNVLASISIASVHSDVSSERACAAREKERRASIPL